MYYITFEDMYTLQFYSTYVYNDQDNPSTTFTEFSGSYEFRQISSPITDRIFFSDEGLKKGFWAVE
jgi:hypothetical protein